jgi:hypothetical protein
MNLFAKLEKSKNFWFLLIASFVFFLLRLPSLFEPYWYGDEGIYQTIAIAMNNGRLLYRDIWDNKPPLLYVIYALFNGDQFSLRLASLLFGILSIVTFFFLLKKIFPQEKNASTFFGTQKKYYIVTSLFAFFYALPLFEGNIANAENFMILFSLVAGLCLFRYLETKNNVALWYVGLLLSFETLFKIVGIFDIAAFGIFLAIVKYKNLQYLFNEIKELLPLVIAFAIPIFLTVFYFFLNHALGNFLSAAFTQNVGYVGYGNTFIIPQGLLYLKLILLGALLGFLFYKRMQIPSSVLFIYIWLSFSLFSAFFSQRPYTHYVLVLLPSFFLFLFLLFLDYEKRKERGKNLFFLQYMHIATFVIILLLVLFNFDIYSKNFAYYQNFISFLSGNKSLVAYQNFFDRNVPKDYAIAQFLNIHTKKDTIVFLWGNSAQIYKMSETLPPGRYTVEYHITGSPKSTSETAQVLKVKKPRFIVIMSPHIFPFDLSHYRYVYSIQNNPVYEYIF